MVHLVARMFPSFISILYKPPQDLVPGITLTLCLVEELTDLSIPAYSGDLEPTTFSQINVVISSSSCSGSPLSTSGESNKNIHLPQAFSM